MNTWGDDRERGSGHFHDGVPERCYCSNRDYYQPLKRNQKVIAYEEYRQLFRITEWRDGAVYKTEAVKTDWFRQDEIEGNQPRVTGLIYAAASDEFASTHSTIRRARS